MSRSSRAPSRRLLWLLATLAVAVTSAVWLRQSRRSSATGPFSPEELRRLAAELTAIEAREQQAEETSWAPEMLAQRCGAVVERLWDGLNAATNKLGAAASFAPGELILPRFAAPRRWPHGIEVRDPLAGRALPEPPGAWVGRLSQWADAGWELAQCEFRHRRFEPDAQGQPGRSVFWLAAHLLNGRETNRLVLEGDLTVDWSAECDSDGLPRVRRVDASRLQLRSRLGLPPFERVLYEVVAPPAKSHFIDPLIVCDRDGDGTNEVGLASANRMFRWRGDHFESERFCRDDPGLIFTGVVADFDGDGRDDFLCVRFEGLFLFRGGEDGAFGGPGLPAWTAPARVRYGQVLTCADVDGDGDLDVWLGQYKNPYDGGQMPTPFYDANDGNPAYLLLNDGHARFADGTSAAGLETRRTRRTYSASLADLDGDGDVDLLVVNDFAGVDVYANDGRGHFRDVTGAWLPDPKVFGMSHVLADFDADGVIDLLVTGMHCPTALRLDALGLSRPERPEDAVMRGPMVRGNLLWRGMGGGRFAPAPAQASLAHSGWSWGSSAGDIDNDGFPDVYIVNGHETRQQTRDYDAEFWLHDIYVGGSREDPAVLAYFTSKLGRTRGHGMSYGGYEKNRLYLNFCGREFVEVAHLFGVAVEADSRNLVLDDFDADGRVDLIFTTFEAWPRPQQTVQVWRNNLPNVGQWVGLRLSGGSPSGPLFGGRVELRVGDQKSARMIVTGDSHRSQHAPSLHFGLGTNAAPVALRVFRPGGGEASPIPLSPNRYQVVRPP